MHFTKRNSGWYVLKHTWLNPNTFLGVKKKWWDDGGVEHMDVKLPTTQAGVQVSSGALMERGVTHIVHAVGPIWTDYKIEEKTFKIVTRKIQVTIKRALNTVSRLGAHSCALPPISGGMVCVRWQ